MAQARLGSIIRYFALFHAWDKVLSQGIGAPHELYRLSRVAPRSFSAKNMCSWKNPAANKLILFSCTTTTSALLLYHYCCMACTYCQQCCDTSAHSTGVPPLLAVCIRTAVNVPHPQNSRCHVQRRFLELDVTVR